MRICEHTIVTVYEFISIRAILPIILFNQKLDNKITKNNYEKRDKEKKKKFIFLRHFYRTVK